jgi:acyl-[acyl carrier protein]--UDP-N-acetylglucosamine O-acyltransferase
MSNVATLAGHITVEDRAVIGGLAAVHQFCRIGTMSIIGGCSKVVQDVPPYMLADGNPARGAHDQQSGPGTQRRFRRSASRAQASLQNSFPRRADHSQRPVADTPEGLLML